jgi:cystathionine gamma-synthase
MKLETIAVHAGGEVDAETGAVAPPIHLSTTFEHGPASELIHGYLYIRETNPTQIRLEDAMKQLEGGEAALAFGSGQAAGAAVLQSLEPGSHVIFTNDIYVGYRTIQRAFIRKWGIEGTGVQMENLDEVKRAVRPNTKVIWGESPSNPLMKISDLARLAEIAHGAGAAFLVDNTFATPVLQRPLELGADIALHSTTKYCGGHSDVQGGCLVMKSREAWYEPLYEARQTLGAVAAPFGCWLVLRGLRSLPCRMEKHCANAMAVAQALARMPRVEQVFYPGLPSHANHDVAKRQMRNFGGMLSILVKGGYDDAVTAASKMKLFINATSLGGTESLVEHRASAEGKNTTSPPNLLRFSIGLEHPDDLIADLEQVLA